MILYVDLRTGEVRDPAIGIVGKVIGDPSAAYTWLPAETVAIELDDDKVKQKRSEAIF